MAIASALKNLFARNTSVGEEFFDGLTDALIEGDVSAALAVSITETLSRQCKGQTEKEVRTALAALLSGFVESAELLPEEGKTNIWMLLGVNGVGKTTTAAKIAGMFKARGFAGGNIILAAADTFRAAAIEQLEMHGEALGLRVVRHQMGSDPSAVVFDAAASRASSGGRGGLFASQTPSQLAGGGLVIADTAGRLHNKEGLVRELQKINKTCLSRSDEGCCKRILVIDATTGQNAVRQAEVFSEAVGLDAIVMAKSDASSKGGAVITIGHDLHIPIAFSCYGEKYSDIKVFNKESFVSDFLGDE